DDVAAQATLTRCTVSANSITSSVTNGNNNGNGNGDNNAGLGNGEGKNNGNAVAGFIHIAGGGIDNEMTGSVTIDKCFIFTNSITSTITNGNNNGNQDGNDDGDGDALASTDSTVDVLVLHGAGIFNAGTLSVSASAFATNSIHSAIRNGNNDGNGNGNNN